MTTTQLTARMERLTRLSEKCWAIVLCDTAPMAERDAAAARCAELDWETGKIAAALRKATR